MARKRKSKFFSLRANAKAAGSTLSLVGKEYSSMVSYAGRELTGQSQKKVKCTLKKRWFE